MKKIIALILLVAITMGCLTMEYHSKNRDVKIQIGGENETVQPKPTEPKNETTPKIEPIEQKEIENENQ